MKEKILTILMNELGYSVHEAEVTAEDLMNLQPTLQPIFQKWFDNREITEVLVSGFSLKKLMEKQGYTFPSALIAMDWLLTEPEVAKKALSEYAKK